VVVVVVAAVDAEAAVAEAVAVEGAAGLEGVAGVAGVEVAADADLAAAVAGIGPMGAAGPAWGAPDVRLSGGVWRRRRRRMSIRRRPAGRRCRGSGHRTRTKAQSRHRPSIRNPRREQRRVSRHESILSHRRAQRPVSRHHRPRHLRRRRPHPCGSLRLPRPRRGRSRTDRRFMSVGPIAR
jgi:hypothetical protein